MAAAPEELAHHRDAQALPTGRQCASGGQDEAWVGPEPAQAATEVGKDFGHVELAEQRQGHHVVHDDQLRELAFPLFPGMTSGQHLADQFTWVILFQKGQLQVLAKLAFFGKLL